MLSDAQKRKEYDSPNPFGGSGQGHPGFSHGGSGQQFYGGANPFENLADFFKNAGFGGGFGGRPQQQEMSRDVMTEVKLDFMESLKPSRKGKTYSIQ